MTKMSFDWQEIVAGAIVLAAAAYLARAVWRMLRGGSAGCGACGSCPSGTEKTGTLVSLDPLSPSKSKP
jgi:hypothetical protein